MIHIYTGTGGGKTTSALGVALRALGHNQKVAIIQFLKGRKDIGEYKIAKQINLKIFQFGTKEFMYKPDKKHMLLARNALAKAFEELRKKPNLLILDEINLAAYYNLVTISQIADLLKQKPKNTRIILTGRFCPKELYKYADIVTEIRDIKRPKIMKTIKGIDY